MQPHMNLYTAMVGSLITEFLKSCSQAVSAFVHMERHSLFLSHRDFCQTCTSIRIRTNGNVA